MCSCAIIRDSVISLIKITVKLKKKPHTKIKEKRSKKKMQDANS